LIKRYLLGDLSEAESAQLEDSAFFDRDQLDELRSVENELIDEYARGELPSQERAKFEKLFSTNPERRQRIEFAMALARVPANQTSSNSIIPRERSGTLHDFFASLLGVPRQKLIYTTAALTLIVLFGSWWLFTRTSLRTEQVVQRHSSGPEQVMPNNGSPGPSPEAPTRSQPREDMREGSSHPAKDEHPPNKNRNAGRGVSHPETAVATFLLLPGLTRSGGERIKLVIPPGRQFIRFKLKLEEHDVASYRSFAAELSRANSQKAWTSGSLSIHRNGTLILNIPASSLPPETADYDLTLRGRTARGRTFENLGFYYLTIVRE
jgi:hypothetical protein